MFAGPGSGAAVKGSQEKRVIKAIIIKKAMKARVNLLIFPAPPE